jgi:hypothetical protein
MMGGSIDDGDDGDDESTVFQLADKVKRVLSNMADLVIIIIMNE